MDWQKRAQGYFQELRGRRRPYRPYRCGNCRTRKNLARELWEYKQPPRCPNCGDRNWRIDRSRYQEWLDRREVFDTCHCDGAHYAHRRGSVKLCLYRPWWLDDDPPDWL